MSYEVAGFITGDVGEKKQINERRLVAALVGEKRNYTTEPA